MKANKRLDPMEKLARDFGLNPVRDKNGQLLVCSIDVTRVFYDCYHVSYKFFTIKGVNKFIDDNYFFQDRFIRQEYKYLKDYIHMTIPGLALLLRDEIGRTACRFMKKFILAVYQQNLSLISEDYILYKSSQILQKRAKLPPPPPPEREANFFPYNISPSNN